MMISLQFWLIVWLFHMDSQMKFIFQGRMQLFAFYL